MPRKHYTYHYIYKVICKISGKYYIGMHSTSDLEDGYFGSGKVLKRSLNKYGKENHTFEILEYLLDRSSLKIRERELVNESLLKDPKCMNLRIGGNGWPGRGFKIGGDNCKKLNTFWKTDEGKRLRSDLLKDRWKNEEYREKMINSLKGKQPFLGKKHTKESIEKMKIAREGKQKGYSNSQYGTCWITNEKENKKIHRGDLIPEGWRLGRRMNTK